MTELLLYSVLAGTRYEKLNRLPSPPARTLYPVLASGAAPSYKITMMHASRPRKNKAAIRAGGTQLQLV